MDVSITLSDDIGEIKMHHTFNGAVPIGRGWMVCNGAIVNQANYDAEHGTGAYVSDNVGSSPIAGKYLPNFVDKYAVGSANTTQNGSTAITSEGNVGHLHSHKWYDAIAGNSTSDQTFDSNGNVQNISGSASKSGGGWGISPGGIAGLSPDAYTSKDSVKPESIQVLFKIKVV
jgi:hypothetical protein